MLSKNSISDRSSSIIFHTTSNWKSFNKSLHIVISLFFVSLCCLVRPRIPNMADLKKKIFVNFHNKFRPQSLYKKAILAEPRGFFLGKFEFRRELKISIMSMSSISKESQLLTTGISDFGRGGVRSSSPLM